jgi:hypothetical protein
MHGHIQYVQRQLLRVRSSPLNEETGIALRSMRTMLVNGLYNTVDHSERLHRLALVNEIDQRLNTSEGH